MVRRMSTLAIGLMVLGATTALSAQPVLSSTPVISGTVVRVDGNTVTILSGGRMVNTTLDRVIVSEGDLRAGADVVVQAAIATEQRSRTRIVTRPPAPTGLTSRPGEQEPSALPTELLLSK